MNKQKLTLLLPATLLILSCSNNSSSSSYLTNSSSEVISSSSLISSSSIDDGIPAIFKGNSLATTETMPSTLGSFTPTNFVASSLNVKSSISLGDGVNHLTYSFNLNSGKNVEAHIIEADLNKVEINTSNAVTIETVNNQITAFEASRGKKVIAGVNADYFATGAGGSSVNAYVNNKNIVKAGHNDKGGYDYTNLNNDIPASKPMLFGCIGNKAKIAPIIENGTIEETIKSKLTYSLYSGQDQSKLSGEVEFNKNKLNTFDFDIVTKGMTFIAEEDQLSIKVKKVEDEDSSFIYGTIEDIEELQGDRVNTDDDGDDYFRVFTKLSNEEKFSIGDYIGYCVSSSDGCWNGYQNIIGGRHSLVENGKISSTVTLENSNGAQRTDTPRTAIGIKPDGKVLVCAIEALRYGGVSSSTSDPYGVNLPELADFMRYIGCYDALNFDGGGSTQLITSSNNGNDAKTMAIRCSDYGSYNVNDARKVYNTLLVTTK